MVLFIEYIDGAKAGLVDFKGYVLVGGYPIRSSYNMLVLQIDHPYLHNLKMKMGRGR